jgi:hypothetical protein
MHHVTRRLSPSLVLAIGALFVALAGTAVADIIIKSPDELGDNVVTGRAVASNAIVSSDVLQESLLDNDLADPQLKIRALGSGSILPGSDGTVTRTSEGTYNVTFDAFALNANGKTSDDTMLNNDCAFTASSRNKLAIMEIDGPFASTPNRVRVHAGFPDTNGLVRAVDTQFDIFASC